MAQVLAEALDAVASPELRTRIFDRALAVAGVGAVPEGGRELLDFVDAYFRAAVVSCLGEALAEEVIAQVEPIVRMASRTEPISEVRVIEPSERVITAAAPPHPRDASSALGAREVDMDDDVMDAVPTAVDEARRRQQRENTPTRIPSERATARAPEDFAARHVSVPKAARAPTDLPPIDLDPLEDPRAWVDLVDDHEQDERDGRADPIDLGTDRPHSEAPEFPDVAELAMTPGPLAAVLLVTPLSFLVEPFTAGLGGSCEVRHAVDGLDILDGLREHEDLSLVVVDCRTHDLDVATIATLLTDRAKIPLLVLWGASDAVIDEVALASDDLRCLAIDADATVQELAKRCLAAGG